jgi:hypothetical protein
MIAIPKFDLPRVALPEYAELSGVGNMTPHLYAQMVYGVRTWEVSEFTITRSVDDPDPEAGIGARVMQTGQVAALDVVPMMAENEDGTGEVLDIPQGEEWRLFQTPDPAYGRDFPWAWIRNITVTPLDYAEDTPEWEIQVRITPRWLQSAEIYADEVYDEVEDVTDYFPVGPWWTRLLLETDDTIETVPMDWPWLLSYTRAYIDATDALWAPFKIQIVDGTGYIAFQNDQVPSTIPPAAGGEGEINMLGETFPTIFHGSLSVLDPDGARIEDFTMTATEWWSYGGKIDTETGAPL